MQSITQQKQNLRLFTAYLDNEEIIIRSNNQQLGIKTQLEFERRTGYVQEKRASFPSQQILIPQKQFSLFMGVLHAGSWSFLTICQDCIQVAKVLEADIYKIETVSFLPLDVDFNIKNKDIYQYLQDLKNVFSFFSNEFIFKFFSFGFYFSVPGNLTYSTQARNSKEDWARESAEQFMWNSNMMEDLKALGISSKWISPIIQGYVGGFQSEVKGQIIDVVMISRRSRHQGGTRYNSRGINDDGYVANFVETEIIMIFKEFLTSYICIRGSVPAFWSQVGMNAPIKLNRPVELTTKPFLKHAYQLVHTYGKIRGIDLNTPTKQSEANLSNTYTTLLEITGVGGFEYQNIDFHHVSSNTDCSGLNPFIHNSEFILFAQKYYAEILQTRQPSLYQKGVFRVNCVDCLDRTNAFMTKVVFMATLNIMDTMGAKLPINNNNPLDILDETNNEGTHPFIVSFKNLWADNGDHLSYIYAGTGCTTSEVTRQGKQGLLGIIGHGFKALTRYYNCNFNDENKQLCIDAVLRGIKFNDIETLYDRYMMNKENDFSYETSQVSLFTLTWNLGGRDLPKDNIEFLVDFQGIQSPDIICIGLQELINSQEQDLDELNKTVSTQLEKVGKYVLIGEKYFLQNFLGIWIKLQLVERFSNIEVETHKFGSVSNLGNKGAILTRFRIDDSLISFISCHLNAGTKKINQRFEDIQKIWDKHEQSKRVLLNTSTYTLLFGNLNFRLENQYMNIVKMIEQYKEALQNNDQHKAKQTFNSLLQYDQFNRLRYKCSALNDFKEAEITFLPTYKFDISSENYDTSKKQRTPSWCDRILIQAQNFEQKFYGSRLSTISDHRPVVAYYIVKIRKIDQIKKDQIKKEYYQKLSKGELVCEEEKQEKRRSQSIQELLYRQSEIITSRSSNLFTQFQMRDKKYLD